MCCFLQRKANFPPPPRAADTSATAGNLFISVFYQRFEGFLFPSVSQLCRFRKVEKGAAAFFVKPLWRRKMSEEETMMVTAKD